MGNPYAPPSGDRTRTGVPAPSGERPVGDGPSHPGGQPSGGQPSGGQPSGGQPSGAPHGDPSGPGGPWPGAAPGPVPPARRPEPDPATARATSRRILHFGLLLMGAVLASTLPLPWQAAALGFVVAALVVGVRAFVLAWRGGVRGAVLPMLGLGLVSAGLVALTALSLLLVWPQQLARQECLATAVTIAATERCQADFRRSVEERLTPAPAPSR